LGGGGGMAQLRGYWAASPVGRWICDTLYVEYAEQRNKYSIMFKFSLSWEYIHLGHLRIHVIYTVD